jgi:hypothetical protein
MICKCHGSLLQQRNAAQQVPDLMSASADEAAYAPPKISLVPSGKSILEACPSRAR